MEALNLPIIRSIFEEGIPEKVNPLPIDPLEIPTEHHLPFVVGFSHKDQMNNAAVWAYRTFAECDYDVRRLYVNAAVAVMNLRLIKTYTEDTLYEVVDGKWTEKRAELPPNENESVIINSMVSFPTMKIAVTVIVATKVNWWLTSSYTRGEPRTDQLQKVLNTYFGDCVRDQLVTAANTIGQWASTLYILKLGGIKEVRGTASKIKTKNNRLKVSEISCRSFSAMPAGTRLLAVSYAAARRLCTSQYLRTCPDASDFSVLLRIQNEVISNRALYHTEGKYITGKVAPQQVDVQCKTMMGRLGTYVIVFLSNSKLALSPHFQLSEVQSYIDYSPQWKSTLQLFKKLYRDAPETVLAEMQRRYVNTEAECKTLKESFLSGPDDPVEV